MQQWIADAQNDGVSTLFARRTRCVSLTLCCAGVVATTVSPDAKPKNIVRLTCLDFVEQPVPLKRCLIVGSQAKSMGLTTILIQSPTMLEEATYALPR